MLRGDLTAGARCHADHQWHRKLAAGHVVIKRGGVHDLIEGEETEVDGHDFNDRPHPAERRTDTGTDKSELRKRRVAHALRAEFIKQSLGHRVSPAVTADVLAHEKDARIAQ